MCTWKYEAIGNGFPFNLIICFASHIAWLKLGEWTTQSLMPITAALSQAIGNTENDTWPVHLQSDCVNALHQKSENLNVSGSRTKRTSTRNRCFLFCPLPPWHHIRSALAALCGSYARPVLHSEVVPAVVLVVLLGNTLAGFAIVCGRIVIKGFLVAGNYWKIIILSKSVAAINVMH